MGFKKNLFCAGAFALGALAAPLPDCPDPAPAAGGPAALTAATLIAIAPKTESCAGADFPDECADASKAATALNEAFKTYKITSKGEQAAIVAYELFESGDFKYNKNHFPGRPGQGTRMMAMPNYVEQYATSVAGADAVAKAKAAGGDAGLVAVLALVNSDDEKSFGSAAWFVSTVCSPEVRAGLAAATKDGWDKFLSECVETPADPARDPAWTAAIANIK
ncbi:hypothetical protein COCVIDRAFT_20576 [Bipolaris victoriae FI3]|uniref:Uncharacterized protein n=2 Tax=Bipolaris TaxID=33194 RepID=W6Y850_COCC2|nr:uncharacterized protein COCCADRAFT_112201 [Bipolaris zeicola 26-R-13]XP_014551116.1 hypothetical protein COCVIDRAFT_20576 [Bipolaris victoriae FI3]EUC27251.1 hypothetical protein COCCADRAFT_112201 [Bipolaris zeicola 26-R-13]